MLKLMMCLAAGRFQDMPFKGLLVEDFRNWLADFLGSRPRIEGQRQDRHYR